MTKKKILWVGESSFVNSGYGIYTRELLSRLIKTGKYEVAELSCYGNPADPRNKSLPWRIYGNMPMNDQEAQQYQSNNYNQFGMWRFDQTCVDFKPTHILSIRDNWMDSHILHSPLRRLFSTVMMPTTDSNPLLEEWIADYIDVNTILTYVEYGKKVLEEESGGLIKVFNVPGMGVDLNIFKPIINKKEHRQKFGLDPNCYIIGTVMRNQRRKLYPDLIQSFAKFCEQYPAIGNKIYLYLHVSYPDLGWDIPRLIRESGISHKILVTYLCKNCKQITILPFQDAKTSCLHCGGECALPNVYSGVTHNQLSEIYNLFDLYVQYAIAESWGSPVAEAASCGIPFMACNYSAMESLNKLLQGIPINILKYYREPESHAYRVYPDDNDFISKLYGFFSLPEQLRLKKGRNSHNLCKANCDWDIVAKKWEEAINATPNSQYNWNDPPQYHKSNTQIPQNLNNLDFIRWCFVNILGDPSKINSYLEAKYLRNLNYGMSIDGFGGLHTSELSDPMFSPKYPPFNRDNLIRLLVEYCERKNQCENLRINYKFENAPEWIKLSCL
jgi:glycosyltransferase involved in cell wall biosynthesis